MLFKTIMYIINIEEIIQRIKNILMNMYEFNII